MTASGARPTLVFVHGLWEGPKVFDGVSKALNGRGFPTHSVTLPSWGTKSPGNPTMMDDIAAIRKVLEGYVDQGKTVVPVLHSFAGPLGSDAVKDLGHKARQAAGKEGGIPKLLFITAGIAPEGLENEMPPFAYKEDGVMLCKDIESNLFNDFTQEEIQQWAPELKSHPAEGYDGTFAYCGWREIPSVYMVCLRDNVLSAGFQRQMAEMAGSEIVELEAGHVPFLRQEAEIVDGIERAATEHERARV